MGLRIEGKTIYILLVVFVFGIGTAYAVDGYILISQDTGQSTNPFCVDDDSTNNLFCLNTLGQLLLNPSNNTVAGIFFTPSGDVNITNDQSVNQKGLLVISTGTDDVSDQIQMHTPHLIIQSEPTPHGTNPLDIVLKRTNEFGEDGAGGHIRFRNNDDAGNEFDSAQINGGMVEADEGDVSGLFDHSVYSHGISELFLTHDGRYDASFAGSTTATWDWGRNATTAGGCGTTCTGRWDTGFFDELDINVGKKLTLDGFIGDTYLWGNTKNVASLVVDEQTVFRGRMDNKDGGVNIYAPTQAMSAGFIIPNSCMMWLNETSDELNFYCKYGDSSMHNGTVSLTP